MSPKEYRISHITINLLNPSLKGVTLSRQTLVANITSLELLKGETINPKSKIVIMIIIVVVMIILLVILVILLIILIIIILLLIILTPNTNTNNYEQIYEYIMILIVITLIIMIIAVCPLVVWCMHYGICCMVVASCV